MLVTIMDCKSVLIYLIAGILAGQQVDSTGTILSPVSVLVPENSPVTLTCLHLAGTSACQWTMSGSSFFINDKCEDVGVPKVNKTLYSFGCDKNFTWTIYNITRENEGNKWMCTIFLNNGSHFESNKVEIHVAVPIQSVSMTSPAGSEVVVVEHAIQTFVCTTSGGLPAPLVWWYKDRRTPSDNSDDDNITAFSTSRSNQSNSGLRIVTSTLVYSVLRKDNTWTVFCIANNSASVQTSDRKTLNVKYLSIGPTIQEGNLYHVIENKQGELMCYDSGGNPRPTLNWFCYGGTESNDGTNGERVTKTVTWIASRGQTGSCICQSVQIGLTHSTRNVSITVDVLYPPTRPIFYIKTTKVSGTVKVIKDNPVSITCRSSGKPNQIQYKWTPSTVSSSGSDLNINGVQNDGQYTCNVQNSMDPSDGIAVPGRNSSSINIEVLYPPSTPTFRYWNASGNVIQKSQLNVIQGDTLKVACISDGKPNPDFQWDTIGNNQLLTVPSIGQTDHKYKCTVKNSMNETVPAGTNPTRGIATSTLTVHVMYPPSSPTLYYQYGEGPQSVLTDAFRKIEGDAETVTVTCDSNSKPRPTFSWNGTLSSHSAVLTLANIGRSKAGLYICGVENEMTRTFGNPAKVVHGRNNGSFNLQILYPPVVGNLVNRSAAEGKSLNVSCPVTVGNPRETTFKWTNSSGGKEWNNQTLTINKVSRNDAKFFYTCEVTNEMQQTGRQEAISKPDRKSFHLNVWYGAMVKHFYVDGFTGNTSVTVNESGTVHFKCNVDSNPGSNMIVQNQTDGKNLTSDTNSKSLEYILDTATCFDTGFYMCKGSNQYNTEISVKQLRLFVNCSPRPSPFIQLKENITSAKHEAAVLTFTVLAHPEPTKDDFKWLRWDVSQWVSLSNNVAYQVDTGSHQSNLTVKDVNRTSYGKYKLTVRNRIGYYEHIFHLLPEDKPEVPTDFEHVQKLVTETSFAVRWKPGFDNGLDQVFILKYRKVSDHVWNIVNIPDTGKSQMNYTVSGLSSGTNYQVLIYASNKLGNSSELEIATITTKAQEDQPDIGLLIGGAVGGSVGLVLFLVLGFLLIRKFRLGKGKDTSEVELNRRQMEDQDDESSEDEVITENAMYESAGGVVKKNLVDDNVYAKPQKKAKTNQDVYAVVNKGKKPGQKKKQKKDKAPKNDTGDIYENAPDVSANKDKIYANSAYEDSPYEDANTATTSKHVKKNADGLIYADLAFNDQPKGQKKLVIHGLDSMTEYVEVDFTKKADPLPDSDTEDQK